MQLLWQTQRLLWLPHPAPCPPHPLQIWVQKWGVSRGVAVGQALLGALCLVRGCSDGGSSSS